MGTLYYGDNLDILQRYIDDASVDLVYLDPPFNSAQNYNAFFQEKDGSAAAAQIQAFEDTWEWNTESQRAYEKLSLQSDKLGSVMRAFMEFLGPNDMMAYLAMMAPRLVELRRALKPTGSLYLHCDPTASHYLKLLLDAVFGVENFRSEITWKRTHRQGNVSQNYGAIADIILFYASEGYTWNQQYAPIDEEYVEEKYTNSDPDGRKWQSVTLRNPGVRPNLHYPYKASNGTTYQPHPNGWSCDIVRMKKYDTEKRLAFPSKPGGQLRLKMYLDESPGFKLQNIWEDIPPINSQAAERMGYPTQKPLPLLERIIATSSNLGDVVLDPFCGCGTTIDAAQKLGRQWLGIDITHLAITLIKNRLHDTYGKELAMTVVGEPTDLSGARELAAQKDKYQFQWWALGLVGARPVEQKKGADGGVDGKILFRDHPDPKHKPTAIIFSVKGGNLKLDDVRALDSVVTAQGAAMGVLLSIEEPTAKMKQWAAAAGTYTSGFNQQKYPRLQLRTIEQLLAGVQIERPSSNVAVDETFKKSPKNKATKSEQHELGF